MIKKIVGANLVEKFPSVPKTDVTTVTPCPNLKSPNTSYHKILRGRDLKITHYNSNYNLKWQK